MTAEQPKKRKMDKVADKPDKMEISTTTTGPPDKKRKTDEMEVNTTEQLIKKRKTDKVEINTTTILEQSDKKRKADQVVEINGSSLEPNKNIKPTRA